MLPWADLRRVDRRDVATVTEDREVLSMSDFAYVGIKPCGCVVAASVDQPERRRDAEAGGEEV